MAGVGFIGCGQMGGAMAAHLVDIEGGLSVCDVSDAAVGPLVEAGATRGATPAATAAGRDLVSIMVLDDAQVIDVIVGTDGILAAEPLPSIIAIHSTISDSTAVAMDELARPLGVSVLDAPVSGGFMGAHAGSLATMVGGTDDAFAAARSVFAHWAELILHFGEVGSGTRAKIARNLLHFISFTAASEAQRLAEASGLSLRRLARVVRHTDAITGGAGSIMLRDTTTPMSPDDDWYDVLTHVRLLGEKDLSLALDLAEQLGVDLPLGRTALRDFGVGLGLPAADGQGDHHERATEDTP